MALKSLEEAVAGRLDELIPARPQHHDAFVNHLSILSQAQVDAGHETLVVAVKAAAIRFEMETNNLVGLVLRHIASEKIRVASAEPGDIVRIPRTARA